MLQDSNVKFYANFNFQKNSKKNGTTRKRTTKAGQFMVMIKINKKNLNYTDVI